VLIQHCPLDKQRSRRVVRPLSGQLAKHVAANIFEFILGSSLDEDSSRRLVWPLIGQLPKRGLVVILDGPLDEQRSRGLAGQILSEGFDGAPTDKWVGRR
jgi:hypothetical protein